MPCVANNKGPTWGLCCLLHSLRVMNCAAMFVSSHCGSELPPRVGCKGLSRAHRRSQSCPVTSYMVAAVRPDRAHVNASERAVLLSCVGSGGNCHHQKADRDAAELRYCPAITAIRHSSNMPSAQATGCFLLPFGGQRGKRRAQKKGALQRP